METMYSWTLTSHIFRWAYGFGSPCPGRVQQMLTDTIKKQRCGQGTGRMYSDQAKEWVVSSIAFSTQVVALLHVDWLFRLGFPVESL